MSADARERLLSAVAVALLLAMVAAVGPAQGDLFNYIAAASAWLRVEDPSELVRLTDYRWLADQAARAGLGDRLVGYTVITPPSLLLGAPLLLAGAHAGRVFQLVQAALLLLSGLAVARSVRRPLWVGLLPFLLLAPAVWSHLWQGQLHLPAVLALATGAWAWRAGRAATAGVLFALAVGLKVHAWPVLVLLVLWRSWTAVGAAALTLVAGFGASVALLGWPVHAAWLAEGVPAGASGMFIDPWHPSFQSLGHGLRRVLVPHETLNPGPADSLAGLAGGVAGAVQGLVVGVSLAGAVAATGRAGDRSGPLGLGALAVTAVAALLSGPILSSYHLVLLAPPAVWVLDAQWRQGHRGRAVLVAGLLVAVGAVHPVPEAPGLLSVPRAWLALALWSAMLPRFRVREAGPGIAVALALAVAMGWSGARRAAAWDTVRDGAVAVEHPDAPLVQAELTRTADGVLWLSAIAPERGGARGRGWVGVRWDAGGGGGPEVVATHPSAHVWAPVASGPGSVTWSDGPAAPRLPGCAFPDGRRVEVRAEGEPGELWLVAPGGEATPLTEHPGHDTAPVCDAVRGRVWFLSDRRVGTRALRLWWLPIE